MRIVCWQTILMKYHTLFFSKNRIDVAKICRLLQSIAALMVKVGSRSCVALNLQSLSADDTGRQKVKTF